MGLIIGFITILLVGFLIIRGYNAKGVLFVGGVGLLLIAVALGKAIGGEKSTGLFFVDISNLIFSLMEKRGGGLGLLIMVLIGFSPICRTSARTTPSSASSRARSAIFARRISFCLALSSSAACSRLPYRRRPHSARF